MNCLQSTYSEPVKEFTLFSSDFSVTIMQLFLHAFPTTDADIQLVFWKQEHLSMFFICCCCLNCLCLPLSLLYILRIQEQLFSRDNSQNHHCYTQLDHLPKKRKIVVVITVECNIPINLIKRNSIEGAEPKVGTEQCSFVKYLSIRIAKEHKKMCPFIEK